MKIRSNRTGAVVALVVVWVCLAADRPRAADREHQQIMADIRMLQEQSQQLQALLNNLGEALRAVNSRLDDQSGLERKSFADGKVQMDSMAGDLRVVREKVDETNVRLGSVLQELETLRDAIPDQSSIPQSTVSLDPGAATVAAPGTATPTGGLPAPVPASSAANPQRIYQGAYADYTSGNYSLAVSGFQMFLSSSPKSPRAHEAQLLIGESLTLDKKDAEAVTAYDRVIANYPKSESVPQAYYKRGEALARLGQRDRARESYETVIKDYPDSDQASLARNRLEALNRPAK